MRILVQVTAAAAAVMMLLFGGKQMHGKTDGEETALEAVEVIATTRETVQETECTVQETVLELNDIIAVEELDAEHVFLYDVEKQEMLFCNTDETDRVFPASVTKLFSAWIALRILPEDTVVTAGWELGMLKPGSSAAFISLDSRLTVEMLIEGMLLPSGNDAALVLAAAVGRQLLGEKNATAGRAVAEFVAEMNRAAQALGFQNSHFENPDGYHGENHYSCPADLAQIAKLALDEPTIVRCMELQKDKVTFVSGQTHIWENTNRLINPDSVYYCPDAVGMKTGYTGNAGYCLMAAFGDSPLVVGVFGSEDSAGRYESAAILYAAWSILTE